MAEVLFWCAVLFLVHTYFLYPVILFALDGVEQALENLRFMRRESSPTFPQLGLPKVSLVVAAQQEAGYIADKLRDSLALDYPAERLEVLVGSDGSTDGTDEIVRRAGDPRVRLCPAPRAGKSSVLNRCIPIASGDIVILTDARTRLEPDAVQMLVRHFEDPEVGAVCGKLTRHNRWRRDPERSAAWSYESLIKLYEGKRGAVMGASGGLYAIRRKLFTALPESTLVEDFVIPLRILEHGFKVVYEPLAVAREETTEDQDQAFGRRARIAASNFHSLAMVPGLLSPAAGFRAFAFWSHKLLRWCAPALMGLALLANLFLLDSTLYRLTFFAQVMFYALAYLGKAGALTGTGRRIAAVAYDFVTLNLAIAVGFWRFLRSSQRALPGRTARA